MNTLKSLYHLFLSFVFALAYGFPASGARIIGVTGTNGKSTVVLILYQILKEAGFKVACFSSIKSVINGKEEVNRLRMTMPGPAILQSFLRRAVDARCSHIIIEVTSEGIKQHRHRFINFETAIFTNLSPEHIEAHKGFENYRSEKMKLFQLTKGLHILNLDDNNSEFFQKAFSEKKIGYTILGKTNPGFTSVVSARQLSESSFEIEGKIINLCLEGSFNINNALAAISYCQNEGIGLDVCKTALESLKSLPGRMEIVNSFPFKVVVDYAFTPNALTKVYQSLKPAGKRMICVLGACGGGRDKWKRPVLGKIAGEYCDEIIVTNEDPYDEDPQEIIDQVAVSPKAKKIMDRRQAIKKALELAKEGDVVVITGKGCEPSICLAKGKRIPWDDRQVVREELVSHPTDSRIKVFGKTKESLFESAVLSMAKLMGDEKSGEDQLLTIELEAMDQDALLADFLGKILTDSLTKKILPDSCRIVELKDISLKAEVNFRKVRRFEEEIKGVTYSGLKIKETADGFEAEILFDV